MAISIPSHLRYQNIEPTKPMYEITNRLYIGSLLASDNHTYLKQNKITHVFNFAEKTISYPDIVVHNYKIEDRPNFNIHSFFPSTTKLIGRAMTDSRHRVLISCHMGINRSMTILIAYLYQAFQHTKSIDDIINLIIRRRPCAMLTNNSFYNQLKHLELSNTV